MDMKITFKPRSELSPYGTMAFSAEWNAETFRYHVWLGVEKTGQVIVEDTIYKNLIEHVRSFNTKRLDINAKVNMQAKLMIKQEARYDVLMALFQARKQENAAFDAMRAEAERLNAIFDAIKLLDELTADEIEFVKQQIADYAGATI
jgi:hypothetical protein